MPITLSEALTFSTETDCLDFKRSFDSTSTGDWLELLKDIVAFSNSGGGFILIGIGDDGHPSSYDVSPMFTIDPADITNKIYKYTNIQFHDFQLSEALKHSYKIVVLSIGPSLIPIVFTKVGTYATDSQHQKTAFSVGTVYFRYGAKSEPGNTDDLRKSFERLLECTRKSWLDGISKIVEAPAGARIAVLPPEIKQSSSPQAIPVRIVDDPDAPAYYAVKVDDSHPHRAKEIIYEVNKRLHSKRTINSHNIICIRRVYQIQKDIKFCYTMNFTSPRYSEDFVDWIISQYDADTDFFEKTKLEFDRLKRENS